VALFGTTSPDHADILVNLDGEIWTFGAGSDGVTQSLHPKTLLFFANNLSSQQHTLVVTDDQGPSTGPFIDVDAFTIYSASTTTTTSASLPSSTQSASAQSAGVNRNHLSVATVAGAVVAAVAGGAILLAFVFYMRRRRHRSNSDLAEQPLLTPALPIQSPSSDDEPVFQARLSELLRPNNMPLRVPVRMI